MNENSHKLLYSYLNLFKIGGGGGGGSGPASTISSTLLVGQKAGAQQQLKEQQNRSYKNFARAAWCYLNDSYRTSVCVYYPPNVIVASALYLAMRKTEYPMIPMAWWILFETHFKLIEAVSSEILTLYEFS